MYVVNVIKEPLVGWICQTVATKLNQMGITVDDILY